MLTQCLPSTGSNSIVLVIVGVTAVAFGIAMTRWSKARTSAVVALLVLGMLAISAGAVKPASASCESSTTIPTTVPENFVTGTIFGVPYPTDDCTGADSWLWHCGAISTPNPDTAATWVTSITATNTVTSELIVGIITDAMTQGSGCMADCGLQYASYGLTGQIHFTLPGVTSGTWNIDVAYVRNAVNSPISGDDYKVLRAQTYSFVVDSVVQSTTNTGVVLCAEDSMSAAAVPLTSGSTLSIYLRMATLDYCLD